MRTRDLPTVVIKVCFALFLVWSSARLYLHHTDWIFMSGINLIFHEAGHVLFYPFGEFIRVLGGTLVEIIVPIIVITHFKLARNVFAAGFGFWWLSVTFWSISVYAGDARAQILPLLGGDNVYHDWTYMLGSLGLLEIDNHIRIFFVVLSLLSFACTLACVYVDISSTGSTLFKQKSHS